MAGTAWTNQVSGLVIVQSSGSGQGLFVYSGTPALGNSPIFWATSATVDPFGNVISSTAGVASSGTFRAGNTLIKSSGLFVYSGTPAAGNLVASVVPGSVSVTDSFGNTALAGINSYIWSGGSVQAISQTTNGALQLGTPAQFSAGTQGGLILTTNGVAGQISLLSGKVTAGEVFSQLILDSQTFSAITNGQLHLHAGKVQLGVQENAWVDDNAQTFNLQMPLRLVNIALPATPTGAAILYADTNSNAEVLTPSGYHAPISTSQGSVTTHTVTQAAATALTDSWTIPATDLKAATAYRLTAKGYGTWGSTVQNLSVNTAIDGSSIRSETISSAVFAASQHFEWDAEYTLFCLSTGVTGKVWLAASITLSGTGATHNLTAGQVTILFGSNDNPGSASGETLNTTASHTMQLLASWASTTGAPTITCTHQTFERTGT